MAAMLHWVWNPERSRILLSQLVLRMMPAALDLSMAGYTMQRMVGHGVPVRWSHVIPKSTCKWTWRKSTWWLHFILKVASVTDKARSMQKVTWWITGELEWQKELGSGGRIEWGKR
ncbi:unnamed protein product [Acanthoscelides obtectus]|uniref:Uncharacterized protein n=1 Tax=Acanthoscelides obtectus TaxID=200917 RepID=A0A9P0PEQ8_ACAOB|nr:unnamed protein product [Acanthoscelides obtectus]CAK1674739.1 hypothetical protein AOBTE_LOCUS29722 [Acanthoscelides obtectus]